LPASPVIIDCDPGHDDAVALWMALASPTELDILGITTVAGNAPVALTQRNARLICDLAERTDIAVHAGCTRPLVLDPLEAADYHGNSGLDGLPPALLQSHLRTPLRPAHAVDFLIEMLLTRPPASVTLACLAPLTNLAVALVKEPSIATAIERIVMMAGARREGGNITPAASYNLAADPHAAHVVARCGRPLVFCGLDVANRVLSGTARLERLSATGRPLACLARTLIAHFDNVRLTKYHYETDGAPLGDPCAIAYLLAPDLFTGRHVNVEIELSGEFTRGMTVVDFWGISGRPTNALWLHEVDAASVYDLVIERLSRL
jgi:purine nucleosidase